MIEGGRDQREGKTDSEISGEQMEIETWNQRRTKTQRATDRIQWLSLNHAHGLQVDMRHTNSYFKTF